MWLSRRAYDAALDAAYRRGKDDGERLLAVMREQHSMLMRQLEASVTREGQRAEDVARIAAAAAFPFRPDPVRPAPRSPERELRDQIERADPWSEVPLGDPRGMFKEAGEASLIPPDLGADLERALKDEETSG